MQQVVLGVDSSTQSTKVVALDPGTGEIAAEGRAPHSGQDVQDPNDWWTALVDATRQVMTNDFDVLAISVAGQQHGLVTLDEHAQVLLPAPLWNNTGAAPDATRLNAMADFAAETGTRLVSSVTIAKLAHLARTSPADLARVHGVCLPHDWLTFRLCHELVTDRGDASGSGWWSPASGEERRDLLALAVGQSKAEWLFLPMVLGPNQRAGTLIPEAAAALGLPAGIPVGPGAGDNMASALGIGAAPGEMVISLGTSGVAYAVSDLPTTDESGEVCGFASSDGRFLPLACMLNCTRVLDSFADLLRLERSDALDLANRVDPGAGGLLLMPYLAGERTPDLPTATGSLLGLTGSNLAPEFVLRAAVDGVAAGLAYCVEALARLGITAPALTLVGGGSQHPVWRQAIADATGLPVFVRGGGEHVARGAALQALAIAIGEPVDSVVSRFRPPLVAELAPRPEMRAAFRLDERRELIEAMRRQR